MIKENIDIVKLPNGKEVRYHFKIGQIIKDDKRDFTIIDRKYEIKLRKDGYTEIRKYYKYKCNKCGFDCGEHYTLKKQFKNEFWIKEDKIKCGHGCNCCCKPQRIIVPNINSFNALNPQLSIYLKNKEEGNYVSSTSKDKVSVICPICGKERTTTFLNMYVNNTIGCNCGDGYSYPEKFIMSFLNQLNIKYKTQLSKKDFSWIGSKRYDFYFEYNNKKYIIETHGMQHYDDKFYTKKEEEQKNDLYKKELALNNGIDCYIELDCRKSNIDWIKNSIIHSELNNIFNLNNIDWNLCDSNGYKNIVRQSCEMFNNGKNTDEIAQILKISKTTICNYLNIGTSLNWCVYDGREEHKRRLKEKNDNKIKPIKVYNYHTGEFIGIYKSVKDCVEQFKNKFGIKLSDGTIYGVLNGTYKKNKGYTFKHTTKEEYLNYINKTE